VAGESSRQNLPHTKRATFRRSFHDTTRANYWGEKKRLGTHEMGGRKKGRLPRSYTHAGMEATAYSSDWRSCGWEWGLALGPLPLYLPLCAGERPSGTVAWPLIPQPRREKADAKFDLLLGGLVLALAGAAGAAAHHGVLRCMRGGWGGAGGGLGGRPPGGGGGNRNVVTGARNLRGRAAAAAATAAAAAATTAAAAAAAAASTPSRLLPKLAAAAAVGAALGATQFPLGRYWAETNLKGLKYYGTTVGRCTLNSTDPPPPRLIGCNMCRPMRRLYPSTCIATPRRRAPSPSRAARRSIARRPCATRLRSVRGC
jgi:hypothetical protein